MNFRDEEARDLAGGMRAGRVLLAGERQGKTLPGFDLGNSPLEYTPARVRQLDLVMTTTNGTRALLAASTVLMRSTWPANSEGDLDRLALYSGKASLRNV